MHSDTFYRPGGAWQTFVNHVTNLERTPTICQPKEVSVLEE